MCRRCGILLNVCFHKLFHEMTVLRALVLIQVQRQMAIRRALGYIQVSIKNNLKLFPNERGSF